jgi:multicomponent K+:H+ antiporter subunit D
MMMDWSLKHLPVLPIIIALFGAAATLMVGESRLVLQRIIATIAIALLLCVGVIAVWKTGEGNLFVNLMGNWRAPFGIALGIDKLSAVMLLLMAIVSAFTLAAVRAKPGTFFYPLFMLQLMGLSGAFVTADLFNLFVFFEVLLAASYGMLLQHTDRAKTNAATHYVVINLVGSAFFLIGVSLLYGITGTLNMADLGVRINALPADSRALAAAASFLLIVVFAIKAAMLPLNFWLTGTYGSAFLPVAALFALMTKVGIVAIVRMLTLVVPPTSATGLAIQTTIQSALLIAAPLTMLLAALGALAARELKTLVGWSIVGSAGLLITAFALGNAKAVSGGLFYLIGTTIAAASMFLIAGALMSRTWRIAAFFVVALVIVGMPPFSGFIGKAVVLAGASTHAWQAWIFAAVLLSSLLTVIAYARFGSRVFWKESLTLDSDSAHYAAPALAGAALLVALVVFAAPLQRFTDQAALDLVQSKSYASSIMGKRPIERSNERSTAPAKVSSLTEAR